MRADDGIGPWLAAWAEQRFEDEPRLMVISRQQWTPELAADIAEADSVLFVDCSAADVPGSIQLQDVEPSTDPANVGTHHVSALQLLGMAQELYGSLPRRAQLLTVGAGTTELSEEFSPAVLEAIPAACAKLEETLSTLLAAL